MRARFVLEIVKDGNGAYYANLTVDGKAVRVIPEYVDYRTLRAALKEVYGFEIPKLSDLKFDNDGFGRKRSAVIRGVGEFNDLEQYYYGN